MRNLLKLKKNWCRHHESNAGPTDYKSIRKINIFNGLTQFILCIHGCFAGKYQQLSAAFCALFLTLILTPTQVNAGWFFELGIGLTKNEWSRPEVDLQSPLGRAVIGIDARDNWRLEFEHTSSIPQDETGNGLNTLWFVKRVDF